MIQVHFFLIRKLLVFCSVDPKSFSNFKQSIFTVRLNFLTLESRIIGVVEIIGGLDIVIIVRVGGFLVLIC